MTNELNPYQNTPAQIKAAIKRGAYSRQGITESVAQVPVKAELSPDVFGRAKNGADKFFKRVAESAPFQSSEKLEASPYAPVATGIREGAEFVPAVARQFGHEFAEGAKKSTTEDVKGKVYEGFAEAVSASAQHAKKITALAGFTAGRVIGSESLKKRSAELFEESEELRTELERASLVLNAEERDVFQKSVKTFGHLLFQPEELVSAFGPTGVITNIAKKELGERLIKKAEQEGFGDVGEFLLDWWSKNKKQPGFVKVPFMGEGEKYSMAKDLGKPSPRYRTNTVVFESDLDKALYIIGGNGKSKSHDKFLASLRRSFPDKTEAELLAAGKEVRLQLKEAGSGLDYDEIVLPEITDWRAGKKVAPTPKIAQKKAPSTIKSEIQREGVVAKRVGEGETTLGEDIAKEFAGAKEAPQKSVKEAVAEMSSKTDAEVRAIADSGAVLDDNQTLAMIEEINRGMDADDMVEKVTNLSSFATALGRNVNYIKELYKTAAGRTMKAIEQYKQLGVELPEGFAKDMLELQKQVDVLYKELGESAKGARIGIAAKLKKVQAKINGLSADKAQFDEVEALFNSGIDTRLTNALEKGFTMGKTNVSSRVLETLNPMLTRKNLWGWYIDTIATAKNASETIAQKAKQGFKDLKIGGEDAKGAWRVIMSEAGGYMPADAKFTTYADLSPTAVAAYNKIKTHFGRYGKMFHLPTNKKELAEMTNMTLPEFVNSNANRKYTGGAYEKELRKKLAMIEDPRFAEVTDEATQLGLANNIKGELKGDYWAGVDEALGTVVSGTLSGARTALKQALELVMSTGKFTPKTYLTGLFRKLTPDQRALISEVKDASAGAVTGKGPLKRYADFITTPMGIIDNFTRGRMTAMYLTQLEKRAAKTGIKMTPERMAIEAQELANASMGTGEALLSAPINREGLGRRAFALQNSNIFRINDLTKDITTQLRENGIKGAPAIAGRLTAYAASEMLEFGITKGAPVTAVAMLLGVGVESERDSKEQDVLIAEFLKRVGSSMMPGAEWMIEKDSAPFYAEKLQDIISKDSPEEKGKAVVTMIAGIGLTDALEGAETYIQGYSEYQGERVPGTAKHAAMIATGFKGGVPTVNRARMSRAIKEEENAQLVEAYKSGDKEAIKAAIENLYKGSTELFKATDKQAKSLVKQRKKTAFNRAFDVPSDTEVSAVKTKEALEKINNAGLWDDYMEVLSDAERVKATSSFGKTRESLMQEAVSREEEVSGEFKQLEEAERGVLEPDTGDLKEETSYPTTKDAEFDLDAMWDADADVQVAAPECTAGRTQCGEYANDAFGGAGIYRFGDELEFKTDSPTYVAGGDPVVGGAFIQGGGVKLASGKLTGHVGIVTGIDDGGYYITDSNKRGEGEMRVNEYISFDSAEDKAMLGFDSMGEYNLADKLTEPKEAEEPFDLDDFWEEGLE